MGNKAELVLFLLWLPQAIHQLLSWIYWWQVKEYRLDRFKAFLNSLDGRSKLGTNLILVKIILLIISLLVTPFIFFLVFVLVLLDVKVVKDALEKKLRRPVFTQRAQIISALSLLGILGIFISTVSGLYETVLLILGEVLILLLPGVGIVLTLFLVKRVKEKDIKEAREILNEVKPLVIGVTGSYGKTTTKEFIAQILSEKYPTQKTRASENTLFGICRMIVKDLKKSTKVLVVEMGAYKKGEISELAGIVKPKVAVITGIEPQHMELFGSLENIKDAKFEIVESLPEEGTAIFNIGSKDCHDLYIKAKKIKKEIKVLGYRLLRKDEGNVNKIKTDIIGKVTGVEKGGIEFEVETEGSTHKFDIPPIGSHFVENILAGILVARRMGMGWSDIENSLKSLTLPEKTMQVKNLQSGAVLIDDSYNSTPHGFESAINYLSLYEKSKKVVVTSGIIELGDYKNEIHSELGILLNNCADEIIVTGKDAANNFLMSLEDKRAKFKTIEKGSLILKRLEELVDKNTVILLEGRQPQVLVDYFERQIKK